MRKPRDKTVKVLPEVLKSPYDIRDYRCIELHNGLTVLLVHDPLVPTADGESEREEGRERKCAAAMSIGVGNLHSPKDVQGVAHMLEHMLTMGSEKFPGEEDYKGFIKEHGGTHEENTDADYGCYSFQVNGEYLEGALERFSQCFLSPLLKVGTLKREIRSLDEEFHGDKDDLDLRLQRLRCHSSNEDHIYNKFLCGNKRSLLGNDLTDKNVKYTRLQEQILAFHRKHYRARNLKLVVIGGESLNVLQKWVTKLFRSLKKGPVTPVQKRQKGKLPKKASIWKRGQFYQIKSNTGDNVLEVSWTLPCLRNVYKEKPEEYMCQCMGHEGSGSLISILKAHRWATSLNAGAQPGGIYFTSVANIFLLNIHLTDLGLDHIREIVGLIYQYIKLLRDSTPEYIFEEMKSIAEMKFNFGDEKPPCEYAAQLSENLLFYPSKSVINADYVVSRWDKDVLREVLDYCTPNNMRLDLVCCRELEDSMREPWFKVRYSVNKIDKVLRKEWREISEVNPLLELPSNNQFLTRNFDVRAECDGDFVSLTVPSLIANEDRMKLWFKNDVTFKVPHGSIYLRINFKAACDKARNCAWSELFILLLQDELSEVIYEAGIAWLKTSISFVDGTFELKVFGFNEHLSFLLSKILTEVSSLMPTEVQYQLAIEDLKKNLMNESTLFFKTLLCEHTYDSNERLLHLNDLRFDDFKEFLEDLRSQLYIEGLCHGNFTKKEATDICEMIRTSFLGNPLPVQSRHTERVICLLPSNNSILDFYASREEDEINVAEVYFQFEQDLKLTSTKWMAVFDLFSDIVEDKFYDDQRTSKQLGYDVKYYQLTLCSVFGFGFQIKSSSHNPKRLQKRMAEFTKNLEGVFQKLDEKSFNNYKNSLLGKLVQKAQSLECESDRLWAEIVQQRCKFDIEIKKAEELKTVEKKDMIEWCNKYFNELSSNCRRLKVRFWGTNTEKKDDGLESEIERIRKFKEGYSFYPNR